MRLFNLSFLSNPRKYAGLSFCYTVLLYKVTKCVSSSKSHLHLHFQRTCMAATLHSRFSLSVKKLGHIRASFFLNLMQIVLDRYSIALHCCRVYQCAESSMISIQTKISHYGVKPSKILLLYSKTAINNPTSNFRNSRILDPDFPDFPDFLVNGIQMYLNYYCTKVNSSGIP